VERHNTIDLREFFVRFRCLPSRSLLLSGEEKYAAGLQPPKQQAEPMKKPRLSASSQQNRPAQTSIGGKGDSDGRTPWKVMSDAMERLGQACPTLPGGGYAELESDYRWLTKEASRRRGGRQEWVEGRGFTVEEVAARKASLRYDSGSRPLVSGAKFSWFDHWPLVSGGKFSWFDHWIGLPSISMV